MKKILFILFLLINLSFALDLTNFEDRQSALQDVKTIILYEESIAKAYEDFILTNYKFPTLAEIKTLIGNLTLVNNISSNLVLSSTLTKISYGLNSDLKADSSIKALYESNTYRKRTYVRNDEINFILEDEFAKHLYDLIKQNGGEIQTCPTTVFTTAMNCKENNHIYIQLTKKLEGSEVVPNTYLMAYHMDNFKNGPIIITNDTSKHITESAFDSIPKGALLYDVDGVKYVKTLDGIEILK